MELHQDLRNDTLLLGNHGGKAPIEPLNVDALRKSCTSNCALGGEESLERVELAEQGGADARAHAELVEASLVALIAGMVQQLLQLPV